MKRILGGTKCGMVSLSIVLAVACSASAQEIVAGGHPIQISAGTAWPLYIGAEGALELGSHFTSRAILGWLPSPYVDFINRTMVSYELYDQQTADLIDSALQNSLVFGMSLGWRPFRTHGLELQAGYTYIGLGGASTTDEIVAAITGESMPAGASRDVDIESALHTYQVGIGWGWHIGRRMTLQSGLSFLDCFASSTRSDVQVSGRRDGGERIEAEVNDYLDGIYTRYVMSPMIRVMAGYQF